MAKPVITYRSSNYVTTAGPTFTASPTWTPAANSLLVALVVGCSASPTDPTGVTGHGQTYSKVSLPTATLSTTHIMSIWVANAGASPSNAAEVASFGGTPTGNAIICFEITGWEVDEDPTNAFGRMLNNTATGTGTTGTVNLSLRPDVTGEHVNLSFWLHLANEATTFRTNWTETAGADGNFNSPATGAEAQFRTDVYEIVSTATWTSSVLWRGIALTVRGTDTTPMERVRISDQLSVSLTPIFTSPTENIKVSDGPVGTSIDAVITENLKVDDIGQGATQMVGVIHVSDVVTAALQAPAAGDLDTGLLTENIKVSNTTVLRTLDPLETAKTESVKVSDSPSLTEDPLQATPGESIKVTDTVAAGLDFLATSVQENVKVSDGPALRTLDPLQSTPTENVKVSESTQQTLDPLQAGPTENIKVADVLTPPVLSGGGTLSPPLLTENLKVDDIGQGATQLVGAIHVRDTVTAVMDDPLLLTASVTEAIKVTDTVTPSSLDIAASLQENVKLTDAYESWAELTEGETVKVSDQVTAQISLIETAISEAIKVSDAGVSVQIALADVSKTENLKVTDTATVLLNPEETTATENLKVSDQVSVTLNPLEPLKTESIKVSDVLSVEIALSDVVKTENIKVSDSTTVLLNPEETTKQENVRVSDTVSVTLNPLETSKQENVKVSDSAFGSFDRDATVSSENVKVSDSLTVQLAHLVPTLAQESVKVSDSAQGTLIDQGTLNTALLQESVKLRDTVASTLDPLEASLSESVKVTDTLFGIVGAGSLNIEVIHVTDTVTVLLNPLQANPTESIEVTDVLILNPAVPVVVIHVRPRLTTIHVGQKASTVHVRPRVTTIRVTEP